MKTKLLKKIRKTYCITKNVVEGNNVDVSGKVINRTDSVLCFSNRVGVFQGYLPNLRYMLYKGDKVMSSCYIEDAHDFLPYCYEYICDDYGCKPVFMYEDFERAVLSFLYHEILNDFYKSSLKKYKILLFKRKTKSLIELYKRRNKYKKNAERWKKENKEKTKLNIKNNKFRW